MPDTPTPPPERHAGGFTMDLSSSPGSPGRPRKRKGPAPVVQQTINLSTKKPETPRAAEAEAPAAPSDAGSRTTGSRDPGRAGKAPGPKGRRDEGRGGAKAGGTSLADLLDPETLARLRGEG